jgi:hypothetical protein
VAAVAVAQTNATCDGNEQTATSGTVTITAVSGSKVTGSYNVTGPFGSKTGNFDVVPCSGGASAERICESAASTCTGTEQCLP